MNNTKYYVIESEYVGPSNPRYIDSHIIVISDTPATGNLDRKPRTTGWCGTTNDICINAHGEYSSIEDARNAIKAKFGACRTVEEGSEPVEALNYTPIECYRVGQYEPMSSDHMTEYFADSIETDVQADSTDEQLKALVIDYANAAKSDGYAVDPNALLRLMKHKRDTL